MAAKRARGHSAKKIGRRLLFAQASARAAAQDAGTAEKRVLKKSADFLRTLSFCAVPGQADTGQAPEMPEPARLRTSLCQNWQSLCIRPQKHGP